MGAYTTLAVNTDSYNSIIETIKDGYTGRDGIVHRPAPHMACCLVVQANLGCRIGDILHLTLSSLVHDGNHYRREVTGQKTSNSSRHQMPEEMYSTYLLYTSQSPRNQSKHRMPTTE